MLAINLLPKSHRLNEAIRGGKPRNAWNATHSDSLKPLSVIAAISCGTGRVLFFLLRHTHWILLGVLAVALAIPVITIVGPFWLAVDTYRHVTSWDTTYILVIDCAPSERPAVRKTLLDQLRPEDQLFRYRTLTLQDNILCYGSRRSALWAVRRLRELGIPCQARRARNVNRYRYAAIDVAGFQDSAAGFLERLTLPWRGILSDGIAPALTDSAADTIIGWLRSGR
jgi:hypothetical protein